MAGLNKNLAVIDIETTGGSAKRERIIEIAILIFDGNQVIDSFETLINPERSIPPFITKMTGIADANVIDAPKFYEVAKKIVEITQDCIFVAHNVRFDYGFVVEEFYNLGFTYSRKQMCTVSLFKKMFPGLRSYSLGNLINHFNIEVSSRHRAYEDAKATLDIMMLGMADWKSDKEISEQMGEVMKETKIPTIFQGVAIDNLPEKTGVYYFLDSDKEIIYIGKSINIKKRIKQHFQKIDRKSDKLFKSTHEIDYVLTGSELIAYLMEAEEIKKHQPFVNRSLRHINNAYHVNAFIDKKGYYNFTISKTVQQGQITLSTFYNKRAARSYLEYLVEKHTLCMKLAGLDLSQKICFQFPLGKCLGACCGKEPAEDYNRRVEQIIEDSKVFDHDTFAIIDIGRSYDEKTAILIENNKYVGYSYFNEREISISSLDDIRDMVKPQHHDKDFNMIIRRFINENKKNIRIII